VHNALYAANALNCQKEANMQNQSIVKNHHQSNKDQGLTILYSRLSVEDNNDKESNSITTQRTILENYAKQHGLHPFIHVVDDGFSGASWQRPGWQEVMSKVDEGSVKAVVVKNLDRMGRDHLRVGLFMEMFRERGIRLVAVNDSIDTDKGEDDFLPFRAIMAEWYARDNSRKVKSALQSKGRSGKPVSTKPPFGFRKDPDDKNKWLVDKDAAAVVRRIFNLTIEGFGPFEICRMLHADKVERPSYYQARMGYVNYSKALEVDDPYLWGTHTIAFLLERPEYAGHTVNFRTTKPSFKSKKQISIPKEEWVIYENTHEAIVPQETWDLVQKLRQTIRRRDTTGVANPLTGLIFCADCGQRLYNHRKSKNVRKSYKDGETKNNLDLGHYTCSSYNNGKRSFQDEHCSPHYVTSVAVSEILLDVIRCTADYVKNYEEDFIKQVQQASSLTQGETTKSHKKQIIKNERRIAELDKLFRSLYEDKVKGSISEERFSMMSVGYEQEQQELKTQNAKLQAELDTFDADHAKADNFIALVQRYTRFEELTTPMLNELVDKVVIHESVWSEQTATERRKGTRSQRIDVYLKYIGNFTAPDMRSAEEIEAEMLAEEKRARKLQQKRESARRAAQRKRDAAKIAG